MIKPVFTAFLRLSKIFFFTLNEELLRNLIPFPLKFVISAINKENYFKIFKRSSS